MKKYVLALSKASYRAVTLYELPAGFIGCFLGTKFHLFLTLGAATGYIDGWYDLKKN